MRFLIWVGLFILSAGCSSLQPKTSSSSLPPLKTLYDFILIDSETRQPISVPQLAQKLSQYDVVFIGEFHGNQASHLLEAQLQAELFALRPNQVLTLEQFNRDHQSSLNQYLDGEIGEQTLIKQAHAWRNYAGSYRPLVEFSKQHFLPVYAANAPATSVRCVGRQGKKYLEKLNPSELAQVAENPFMSDVDYQTKFDAFMQHSRHNNHDQRQNSYFAQLLRDNTMAETILKALQEHPEAQILHLNGTFHSESFLGTVTLLQQRNAKLNIAVISPVRVNEPEKPTYSKADLTLGNAIYLVQPQPAEYVQQANRIKAFRAMFKNADANPCKP